MYLPVSLFYNLLQKKFSYKITVSQSLLLLKLSHFTFKQQSEMHRMIHTTIKTLRLQIVGLQEW